MIGQEKALLRWGLVPIGNVLFDTALGGLVDNAIGKNEADELILIAKGAARRGVVTAGNTFLSAIPTLINQLIGANQCEFVNGVCTRSPH